MTDQKNNGDIIAHIIKDHQNPIFLSLPINAHISAPMIEYIKDAIL